MRLSVHLLAVLILSACASDPVEQPTPSEPAPASRWAAPAAIAERVAAAEQRLQQTEGGRLVWDAIAAHGGLTPWFSHGPLAYRFAYTRANGTSIDTYQQIDVWSSRARHQLAADTTVEFGWSGEDAWQRPSDADTGVNARFWALTPYYFVGVPFVFADPGVNHEVTDSITVEGTTYAQVFVTFGENVGDAPDDYYYLLLDPETDRVAGVRYIVTYPGFYAPGSQSAERLLLYDGSQSVDGMVFPTSFRAYPMPDDGEPANPLGEPVTTITLTDVAFRPQLPLDHFDIPAGAQRQASM